MRLMHMPRSEFRSCEEREVQNRQMTMAISMEVFPLVRTGPVSALVIRGISRPVSVAARADSTIIAMSFTETQLFMYLSRSGMPIFLWGRG